jgi:hypothetical protein
MRLNSFFVKMLFVTIKVEKFGPNFGATFVVLKNTIKSKQSTHLVTLLRSLHSVCSITLLSKKN